MIISVLGVRHKNVVPDTNLGIIKMKRLLLLSLLLFPLFTVKLFAQDVIVKKDNSTILSKVVEISDTEIKYKKWSNQDGPTYSIKKTEVFSINYSNGDIDKFSDNAVNTVTNKPTKTASNNNKANNIGGYMKRSGKYLTLDGRQLSDYEVRKLVGEANYKTYLEAQRQVAASNTWDIVFWTSLAAGTICFLAPNPEFAIVGVGCWVVTDISLACSIIFDLIGSGRLNWVADEYNKTSMKKTYSFNIAPSIMKCSTPQLQNNYGAGLTLSLNF